MLTSVRRFARRGVFVLTALLCLSAGLLFTGCPQDLGGDLGNMNGNWVNVAGDYVTRISIDAPAKKIVYENAYEGDILGGTRDFTASQGVIIIKFTEYWTPDYSGWPVVTYTKTPANYKKFGALYWRDLTSTSVRMSDAYVGYVHTMFSDSDEAKANFTLGNVEDYVDWSITSPYYK